MVIERDTRSSDYTSCQLLGLGAGFNLAGSTLNPKPREG